MRVWLEVGGKRAGWASLHPSGSLTTLFSCRCYILENDTVQCDLDLYKSLQAWKDHKLHIDHEVWPLGQPKLVTSIHRKGRGT